LIMENNSTILFQLALGLSDPWCVTAVRFEETLENKRELHIDIDFKRGSKFPADDGTMLTAYDTVERQWEHLNFFEHRCLIHARVPRIRFNNKTQVVTVPWARKNSGFTLLFEAFAMLLIENEMPVSKAAGTLGVNPPRIWTVFSHWVDQALAHDQIPQIESIGFDETSSKKGHNYVTTAVDMKTRRVLFAAEGKNADTIKQTTEYLESKDVDCTKITNVCIDMSPAFICGCSEHIPNAAITFDKFHVVKEVNSAMDELRRLERRGNNLLKGHKYLFLKGKVSSAEFNERELLMEYYPKLGEGYRLKEMLTEFWDIQDREEAEGYLTFWCDMVKESRIQPFIRVANMIKAHWSGVVNYIESRITNGILEGINSKIQLAKKRARGFRKVSNFIRMIYFTCGKLKFNYPRFSI